MGIARKILYLIICIAVIVVLSELSLRIYDLRTGLFSNRFYVTNHTGEITGVRVPHPSWHHGLLPDYSSGSLYKHPDTGNYVAGSINKDGFRDDNFEFHADEFRIFFLGDSHTEGYFMEQEEAIPQTTERKLRDAKFRDGKVRTFNFGIGSASPLLSYRILRQYIDRFHPHLVVYIMNGGDLFDDAYFGYADRFIIDSKGLPIRLTKQKGHLPNIGSYPRLKINFYTFYLLSLAKRKMLREIIQWMPEKQPSDSWRRIRELDPWYAMRPGADPEIVRKVYQEAFKVIVGMKNLCREYESDFLVIHLPLPWEVSIEETPTQTYFPEFPGILKKHTSKGYYESFSKKLLLDVAEDNDVDIEIPLDFLRKRATKHRLYLLKDSHIGPKGAEAYADFLTQIVIDKYTNR